MGLPPQPGDGYIAAADICGTRVCMMLARSDGTRAAGWSTHIPEGEKSPGDIVTLLRTGLEAMLAAAPSAPLLESRFGVPASVENDTNLAALGEHAPGAARGVDDFLFVALDGGVGSHPSLCMATSEMLRRNEFAMPELRFSALGTEAQLYGAVAVSLAALDAARRC